MTILRFSLYSGLLCLLFCFSILIRSHAESASAPDRSRLARVSASSWRLARLEEVPQSRNLAANLKLAVPFIRPRWVPRYAIDGSPLTYWASAEDDKDLPWLKLELGNRLRPRPMVTGLVISWGKGFATRYRIMASSDGDYWKPVFERDRGAGGKETIALSTPAPARALRLEALAKSGKSVEVVDLQVFGDPREAAPAPARNLRLVSAEADRISLRWEQEDEVTFCYRLYRSERRDFRPAPETLVATVDRKEWTDLGLRPGREYHYLVVPETFAGRTAPPAALSARTAPGAEFARFPIRGVVEGFYNDPWPHPERLRMMEFLAGAGFNYYLYGPKMDPFSRQLWREPYPAAELRNFAELAACARGHGLVFNYGISPGLDMDTDDPGEVKRLRDKLRSLFDAGVRAFTLCLDDIPDADTADRKLGQAHARLVNDLFVYLRGLDPDTQLLFVPTVYSHTHAYWVKKRKARAEYLEALAAIDPAVGIMWTGPGDVFSAEIGREDAADLMRTWKRKPLIWDNYPVNDILLRNNLFTGPYLGRALDLGEAAGGIMLNPMYLPHASKIALYTAGQYLTRRDYEPWRAYDEALRFLGGDEEGYRGLRAVSDCLLPHPVFPQLTVERMPIYQAVEEFWAKFRGPGQEEAALVLRGFFRSYAEAPKNLRLHLDPGLADDLMGPAEKLALYGQAGIKSLDLLAATEPDQRALLRGEIVQLQAQARLDPWRVTDEATSLPPQFSGRRVGRRNVLDDYITRALRDFLPR
jgi:hyaluronoglucosaminidase